MCGIYNGEWVINFLPRITLHKQMAGGKIIIIIILLFILIFKH